MYLERKRERGALERERERLQTKGKERMYHDLCKNEKNKKKKKRETNKETLCR